MGKKGKGTGSFGKRRNKTHTLCRRCGKRSFHIQKTVCGACGYPSAKIRGCKFYHHSLLYFFNLCRTLTFDMQMWQGMPKAENVHHSLTVKDTQRRNLSVEYIKCHMCYPLSSSFAVLRLSHRDSNIRRQHFLLNL